MEFREHPLDGITPTGLKSFDSSTRFGRVLRQADARQQLQRLDEQQFQHQVELLRIERITNRLRRISELARYDLDHLMTFGVISAEREEFRRILHDVVATGEFTLREAAAQARLRASEISEQGSVQSSNADRLLGAEV